MFGGTLGEKNAIIEELHKRWESSEVKNDVLLGVQIIHDRNSGLITLLQMQYFKCMLEHFGLQNICSCHTPLPPNLHLHTAPNPLPKDKRQFMANKPYCKFVGCVMWGQGLTRPDISFAAGLLARYQLNPRHAHWECIEWLVGYIRWSLHYAITY